MKKDSAMSTLNKTLKELEIHDLNNSDIESNLVKECKRLINVPLKDLTIENLRLLIGQKLGLKHLIPIALNHLEVNPLTEGMMYKGDLLANVALIDQHFWKSNPKLNNRLVEVINELKIILETINGELLPPLADFDYL